MAGFEKSFAFADEDVDRSTEDKTSAVHFMRFEFSDAAIAGLRNGASLRFGIEYPSIANSLNNPNQVINSSNYLASFAALVEYRLPRPRLKHSRAGCGGDPAPLL